MYSHIRQFSKEDVEVVMFDVLQLAKMDEKAYLHQLKATYTTISKTRPVIIIHPMLKRGAWLRFQPQNIFLTNDHIGRDYVQELVDILNAPTKLEVLVEFIKNSIKEKHINFDLMKRKYMRLEDIPSLEFHFA